MNTGVMAEVVEHLPSKYNALNSNPSTAKTEKKMIVWAWWHTSVIPYTQGQREIRRVTIGGHPGQKVSKTSSE
jgi:hypothetical protein